MERCLLMGCVLGLIGGAVMFVQSIGVLFAGIEALLCLLMSVVCFAALAILDALKRGHGQEAPPALVVKPRRAER